MVALLPHRFRGAHALPSATVLDVATGDFNGDGRLDAAVLTSSGSPTRVRVFPSSTLASG